MEADVVAFFLLFWSMSGSAPSVIVHGAKGGEGKGGVYWVWPTCNWERDDMEVVATLVREVNN